MDMANTPTLHLKKYERRILEAADAEAERLNSFRTVLHNTFKEDFLMDLFFTTCFCVMIYKGKYMFLALLVPMIVLSFRDMWRDGRIFDLIDIRVPMIIFNIVMMTYFIGIMMQEHEYTLMIIYGIMYIPIFVSDYNKNIKEIGEWYGKPGRDDFR